MRILVVAVLALALTGCFEEGEIKFSPNKIEVTVTEDSQNIMGVLAESFLRAERGQDGYLVEGFGRPVRFNSNGIVPSACTGNMNCREQTAKKPVFVVWSSNAILNQDSYYPPGHRGSEHYLQMMENIFATLNLDLVGIAWGNERYGEEGTWVAGIDTSNSTFHHHWNVVRYVDLVASGEGPNCWFREWSNLSYNWAENGCDGVDWGVP